MPALSKEIKREHEALIRRVLVQRPDASLREIKEALQKVNRTLDIHYISSLVNKIRNERAERMERQLVNTEIAKFEDVAMVVMEELWKVSKSSSDDRAKVSALKSIVESYDVLLNRKFDAGIFERNLGSVKVSHHKLEEYKVLIVKAFENFGLFKDTNRSAGSETAVSPKTG